MSRGNVCAESVVFSLSAPGPGLPSNKVTQRSTLDLALLLQGPMAILRKICNMYGRQLVNGWFLKCQAKRFTGRVVCK